MDNETSGPKETQGNQGERLATVGLLAATIAHDLNNLMYAVVGAAEAAMGALSPGHAAQLHLTEVMTAAGAARGLTRLLEFVGSRGPNASPYPVEMPLRAAAALFETIHRGGSVRVKLGLPHEGLLVRGRPAMLQSAVLNVLQNSYDAMPGGGTIDLVVESVPRGGGATWGAVPEEIKGRCVHIAIHDEGTGMAPEIRARCTEPLFTTKGNRGTGLGLSSVGIAVSDHGGVYSVDSEPDLGTTVDMWLPEHTG